MFSKTLRYGNSAYSSLIDSYYLDKLELYRFLPVQPQRVSGVISVTPRRFPLQLVVLPVPLADLWG